MKFIYISLLTFLFASCSHHPLLTKGGANSIGGEDVVLMKPNLNHCKFIKEIEEIFFFHRKNALNVENHFKNSVAKAGGNVGEPIQVKVHQPYIIGNAYKCESEYISKYKKNLYSEIK
ncbi:hypothetical protein ACRXCV_12080 [Halobacteriovorax sp. GFR7]|uniref:hypothetical protein n=1 Tax=unclassified Halobacteriovorax TaxID=2639665 RepID=UPI003D97FAAC